jgi:arylsulfatase A-like enzyme
MIKKIGLWLFAGSISGSILGIIDIATLFISGREMFFSSTEMLLAMGYSLAICAAAGTLLGLLAAVLDIAICRKRWRPWIIALMASPLYIALFWLLTRGPQASAIPARSVLVTLFGTLTGVASGFAITGVAAVNAPRWRMVFVLASAVAGVTIALADVLLFIRLYLPFHMAASLFAWMFMAYSALQVISSPKLIHRDSSGRTPPRWIAGTTLIAAAVLSAGIVSLIMVRQTQNIRFVLGEKAANSSDVVLIAKSLVPPPEEKLLDDTMSEDNPSSPPVNEPSQLKLPGASVVLITVDAMRYDRLRPGAADKVAPAINGLATRSVVFNRAYTALPHTSYAVASLLTGKYIKPLFELPQVTADQETWPEIMRRFRYRTGGFFTRSVFFVDRAKFAPLEKKGYGFGYLKMEYRYTAAQKVDQTLEFLEKAKDLNAPVFTWVHLFEPHEPYKENCTRFGNSDEQRYDCEIHTADQQIERLVEYVEKYFPDTIVIVSADHGEEFNDHGGRYHGTTLYDEQARVPLLIRVPGVSHRIVDEPVNLVDLMGTVLNIVDIPVPARVRSQNLTGLILGTDTEKKAAFSQLHERRMVVYDSHKLIWDQASGLARLYDLKKDPKETISIADQNPQLVSRLKQKIAVWETMHAKTELRPVATAEGATGWPDVLQKAMGGDDTVTAALIPYLTDDTPAVVRQKAAELIHDNWRTDLPEIPFNNISDPVCLGWLWSAMAASSPDKALPLLQSLSSQLPSLEPPWIRVQLTRLDIGDEGAISAVIDIANARAIAPAIRREAISRLGDADAKQAENSLIALLNNYLLRQEAAKALAQLSSKAAAAPILGHLKTEPFANRRAELAEALVKIAGHKVFREIAFEMANQKPLPNGLTLLREINALTSRRDVLIHPETRRHISMIKGPRMTLPLSNATTLYFQTSADVATVQIRCNDQQIALVQNISANVLQTVSLTECAPESRTITLSLSGDPLIEPLMLVVW